jgi:RimJ/RimL family protein N-acetyltransferase
MSKNFKKLIGKKVYLSPWSVDDAETFVKWLNDPRVTDGLLITADYHSVTTEKEHLAESTKKTDKMNFTIVTNRTNKPIGTCSIMHIDNVHRSTELALMIGEKSYRGKGIGQEVLGLLLDYCFNYLNFHSVCLKVLEDNIGAIKCYEKVGFKKNGTFREALYINGEYRNGIYMDMLRKEFGDREYITNKFIK